MRCGQLSGTESHENEVEILNISVIDTPPMVSPPCCGEGACELQ
jgi:hypothetical protein